MSHRLKKCLILLFWLAVWFGIAIVVNNKILLATPVETLQELVYLIKESDFYMTIAGSFLRIGVGFVLGFFVAVLLAGLSKCFTLLEELLLPLMNLIKAVPIASFVVLLLIWWGSAYLSVAICFLVVLPNIYITTLEGLKSTDIRLLEMSKVFRISNQDRFFYIYRPALKPFLYSSMKVSLGMCWKSGVAAELIGTPDYSIGEQLYLSKIYINTAGVFAWTAVIILLSIVFEKIVLKLTEYFFAWEPRCLGAAKSVQQEEAYKEEKCELRLTDITKVYDDRVVLDNINKAYEKGGIYYLTSPSGSGKTTLLRILAGLTKPDSGSMEVPENCSMVFQEDRLCEDYSAVKNVEIVTGDKNRAEHALRTLLEADALNKPCKSLSGGMKRRVALVRAMEADADFVLLDEPFTGMDKDTRANVEEYIKERQNGRTIIIATHI